MRGRGRPIAVAGYTCLDVIPALGEVGFGLAPGHTRTIGPGRFSCGGAIGNTGLTLARLGLQPRLITILGDDDVGNFLMHQLGRFADVVQLAVKQIAGEASAYSLVLSAPGRDRSIFSFRGCNATMVAADIVGELTSDLGILHFGYPNVMESMYADRGRELVALLDEARRQKILTSVDLAGGAPQGVDWPATMRSVLPAVDCFVPSWSELKEALGVEGPSDDDLDLSESSHMASIRSAADRALDMGAGMVLVKLGARGMYLRTSPSIARLQVLNELVEEAGSWCGQEIYLGALAANVADTTGAGDAAIAGFLAGLSQGESAATACKLAASAAAFCVEAVGGASGVPLLETVLDRAVKQSLELRALRLPSGWHWDLQTHCWRGPRPSASNQ